MVIFAVQFPAPKCREARNSEERREIFYFARENSMIYDY